MYDGKSFGPGIFMEFCLASLPTSHGPRSSFSEHYVGIIVIVILTWYIPKRVVY